MPAASLDQLDQETAGAGHVIHRDDHLHRSNDRIWIAPDCSAMFIEDLALATELVRIARRAVPDVSMLRNDAQGNLLAAGAYQDRRVRLLDRLRLADGAT